MTIDILIEIAKHSIFTMLLVVGPVMIASFIVGIIMSLLQAIFQIHEQTFSFVPKLLAIMITLVVFAPWMVQTLIAFSADFFGGFNKYLQ